MQVKIVYSLQYACRLFEGVFAKLQKVTTSFVMSICLIIYSTIRMERDSQWMEFQGIGYLSIFENLMRKFKFH
jgi:hypothetical protein